MTSYSINAYGESHGGPRAADTLLATIAAGRAVLVLGQRHSTGLVDELIRDVATLSGAAARTTLQEQLQELETASRVEEVRRAFDRHRPDDELLEIARCPWSMAAVSAVDPLPLEAFNQVGSDSGRRLRVLFPSQARSLSASVNPAVLTVVRLFGSTDEQVPAHLPPLTVTALRQRRAFDVGPVFQQLPFLAASGMVVIAGVGEDDWVPLDLLALACSALPAGSVHWFLGHERPAKPSAFEDFGDALVVHEGTLPDFLRENAATDGGRRLAEAQDAALSTDDHIISYAQAGETKRIVLSAQEWRNIAQSAVILDDAATVTPPPLAPDEMRTEFRHFLRGTQRPPDWSAIVRGFLYERDIGQKLADTVEAALTEIGSVNPTESTEQYTVNYSRRPILLTGPPASGKSRLIHWLAVNLRRRGHVVMYLAPTAGRLKIEAIERVCRLLQARGAQGVAVLADELDNAEYAQLAEALAAAGRNAVVVGSARHNPPEVKDDDPRRAADRDPDYLPIPVARRLSPREVKEFGKYLEDHGERTEGLTTAVMRDPYFLLFLYYLLPDTRGNVRLRVGEAYDRLALALDAAGRAAERSDARNNSELREQLKAAASQLFPNIDFDRDGDSEASSPFAYSDATREALDLALLCARLKRPIPVDLLLRVFGTDFIRKYAEFSRSLGDSDLMYETVDEYGSVILNTDHDELARLALVVVRPSPPDQMRLLEFLVDAVQWRESNYPGDDPDQDYCIEILRLVGPRGEYADDYSGATSLELLAQVLERIRRERQVRIPKLLLLEAQALRMLANRDAAEYDASLEYAANAIEVLEQAEEVLQGRRATDTRNLELHNLLTTRAAVHGYKIGCHLRRLEQVHKTAPGSPEELGLRKAIEDELELVSLYVGRTRALGRTSFFPLDVNFWTLRDVVGQIPGLSEVERVRVIAQMASILDTAVEEPLEPRQVQRFLSRRIELAELEGQHAVSAELAEGMRREGDFSGYCQIIRTQVYDPKTRRARSPAAARQGLNRLLTLDEAVSRSRVAMTLAHHLWMEAHLPGGQVGGADPVYASCTREEWEQWSRILHARLSFPEDEDSAFVTFCLAWSLLQLSEPHAALSQIAALEANSAGSRRRVGCLAVLSCDDGNPKQYRAVARRRQGDVWICYMPQLLTEIRVSPAVLGPSADLQVGTEILIFVGLNYRGLLPWDRRTEIQRPPAATTRGKQPRGTGDPGRPAAPARRLPPQPSPAVMPQKRPRDR